MDATNLEEFGLMISCVDRLIVAAWVGDELSSVDLDGSEGERAVCVLNKGAVLPLDHSLRALWVLCCCLSVERVRSWQDVRTI